MTNKHFFLSMAATALLGVGLTACTSDDPSEGVVNSKRQITFTGTVSGMAGSRAASDIQNNKLEKGNTVGLFIATGSTDNYSTIDNGNNLSLTVGDNGALTTTAELYWGEDALNFFAYMPYSADYNDKLSASTISFSVQSDQIDKDNYLASDLLYGVPDQNPVAAPASDSDNGGVTLAFTHKLSKVIVTWESEITLNSTNPEISLVNLQTGVSLNLTTGEVTTATEATADIKVGAPATGAQVACVVPAQTVASGAKFIKIVDGDDEYFCSLAKELTLASGSVYTFAVKFKDDSTVETKKVELSLTSTTTDWTEVLFDEDPLNAPTVKEVYTIGDYLTSDGKFVKSDKVTTSDNVVGVIFATEDELSSTDKGNGYTAYVLGLTTLSKAKYLGDGASVNNISLSEGYTLVKTLADAANELDGLTQTKTIQELGTSNYLLFDLTNQSLTEFNNNDNFSQWFIPSIGQMIQILNNLGKASIPTDNSTNHLYGVDPDYTSESSFSTSGKNYTWATSPTRSDLMSSLKASANNQEIFTESLFVTSSLYKKSDTESNAEYYMLGLTDSFVGSGHTNGWGLATGNSNSSERARVACIATKLPLTNE